jgi:general nucleoside transport system permease protein
MDELNLTILLSGVLAGAAPVVLAALGETITEKAGVINLSLDGTILLSAMTAFSVSFMSQSLVAGFIAGALAGGIVAAVMAFFAVFLGQSQVAVGFVLTLMTRDLAYFIGNPFSRLPGPSAALMPVPGLASLPFFGPVFFSHSLPVYLSMAGIFIVWGFLYRTPMGLNLMAVGEHPAAAYARGINPRTRQFWYAVLGGLMVGLAGACFSLAVKPGWGRPQGAEGTGWIALALVIFGGWHPIRVAFGAYLFSFLQIMGIYFQGWLPTIPSQVFQVAPFPLMIFTLLIMGWVHQGEPNAIPGKWNAGRRLLSMITGNAPTALGRPYSSD